MRRLIVGRCIGVVGVIPGKSIAAIHRGNLWIEYLSHLKIAVASAYY
jgi:hypothetical protein